MSASSQRVEPAPTLRFVGACDALDPATARVLFDRTGEAGDGAAVRDAVSRIISRVRRDGDRALRELAAEFDGVALETLEVPRASCTQALEALDPAVRRAMERAARNIERVHGAFLPFAVETESEPGVTVGRRPDPLARVGVYAPGGRAAYPSSVLMGVIPARVAGVPEVIVCSPPSGGTRLPSPAVLAAAALAGADRVFAIGGAGAVAAMAYGTETIGRVDRVVGPGNAYVAEAKVQVASAVGIDSPAGPSELLVLCDNACDPVLVAREMLAQAEHDPLAAVVAVTVGEPLARAVVAALEAQLPSQPRAAIATAALRGQGAVVWSAGTEEAIAFANRYAVEHLLLLASNAETILPRLRNAGTVFVGPSSSVAFGDYMTGANHVLPTGGLARVYSGLSTGDFVRWTTWQHVTADAAARLAADTSAFAEAEGLGGHAFAARSWMPAAQQVKS